MNNIYDTNDKLDFLIARTGTLIKLFSKQIFNEHNFEILPEQFIILLTLAEHKELYQREIGLLTVKDRPNINRLVSILEEKGYVERAKETITKPEDTQARQVLKVKLTNSGKEIVDKIMPIFIEFEEIIYSQITNEELETCIRIIKKINNGIREKVKMQL